MKKLISIVTPCYNEELNVREVYNQVKEIFKNNPQYRYEHIFIDNDSQDSTIEILKNLAKTDKNLKLIVNIRNFGPLRSPYYALLQAKGDAAILFVADLQDPPQLITEFLTHWHKGHDIVVGVKNKSEEGLFIFNIRKFYYWIMSKISKNYHVKNFTSYALFDRAFIRILGQLDEKNPYIRGLIGEFGLKIKEVPYLQPKRKRGKSAANFYILFDIAMLGFVNTSKVPLRLATIVGMILGIFSLGFALLSAILKFLYWDKYPVGIMAVLTALFFFSSVQLFFIGIVGEYIGAVYTEVKGRPLVIEKERVNFD